MGSFIKAVLFAKACTYKRFRAATGERLLGKQLKGVANNLFRGLHLNTLTETLTPDTLTKVAGKGVKTKV